MKKLFSFLLALFIFSPSALAFNLQAGDEVFVNKDISDDTYAAGGLVQVDANINGDLVIGGGKILINGNVSQDLTVGGGDVTVAGEVADDVRIGGGNVQLSGIIKDDLFVGGGNVDITDSAFVGGDLVVGGGNLVLNGDVQGSVIAGLGNIVINGRVTGNVILHNADKITFGPKGRVMGNLWYKSRREYKFTDDQVAGKVTYNPSDWPEAREFQKELPGFMVAFMAGFQLYALLSLLFFGLFLLWIYRYFPLHVAARALESPLRDLGVGLIVLLVGPVIALLLMITIIGIPLGLIVLGLWMILLCVAKAIAAAIIGAKIVRINEKSSFLRMYGSFASGALIFVLLGLIPVFGWLLKIFLILTAIGATALYHGELSATLRKKKLA